MSDASHAQQPVDVLLHRRVAVLRSDRIDIRPAPGAVVAPLFGFLLGVGSAAAIWFGLGSLPLWLLAILLIVALVAIPFAGIGTIYALVGAHVVIDKAKGSATWQQGFLGMGVGTTELVPFAKVDRIVVEEAGANEGDTGQPTEEFAQWKVIVAKKSGKRLEIGVASGPQSMREESFDRAWTVADAIATMTDAPLEVYVPPSEEGVGSGNGSSDGGLPSHPDTTDNPPSEDDARGSAGDSREVRA